LTKKRIGLGKHGEMLARNFLSGSGYHIIDTNFRTRCGEIDIIAKYNKTLIFIEVKTRMGEFLESPLTAVTVRKQRSISMVAQEYLSRNKLFEIDARFDVIAVRLSSSGKAAIEHIKNAFDLCYGH
jgi:putative endonuclease